MDPTIPSGTVTFLFTDIEGSTKLWEAHPELMRVSLARHDVLLREAIVNANGYVFKTVGDAFCAAFASAPEAVAAALAVQLALDTEPWPEETPIKVRSGLHTGAVESRDRDYFGPPVNRVARLQSTGYGGQTLLSQATYELSRDALPEAASLRDLGAHRLKDLARPEQVYELQHPDLRDDFPPIKSLSTHPNNLPQQLTSFIGREKEIAEVEALLVRNRLLTLTGSGGSGKTRLGLQVAAESLAQFPDGAWFVELAPLSDPALVPQTVATVLGVTEEPGKPIAETLAAYLKDKRLLILLDNCEHLLDACAKLADTLLRQCPNVRILASSREALGIRGEKTYRVPSLSLPDRKQAQTPQSLSTYESVRLFIDRALLVRDEFQVTNQNAPALASVCCRLDGIPLAIELAAARVRTLSVEELEAKLDQRFRLLTGGSRTALPRHQTLRALIDWSYDLLSGPEKLLLQRLSVFAGGWTLQAAEQVCAGDGVAHEDILELLTSLSDKSLVVAEPTVGHSRYRLLETVQQYSREKLKESGLRERVRRRHRDYFLALVEEAEPNLITAKQIEWLHRLEEVNENLRAALQWSLSEAGSDGGFRLCGALHQYWKARGRVSEGRAWCDKTLDKSGGDQPTRERANALSTAGAMAAAQSDYPSAKTLYEESLTIRQQLGDLRGTARTLSNLSMVTCYQGDYLAARVLGEDSLAILRQIGEPDGIAGVLLNLGNLAFSQSDYAAAWALYEESLEFARRTGEPYLIANTLHNMALVATYQKDYSAAQDCIGEYLSISLELGNPSGIAESHCLQAMVSYELGDFPAALQLYREALPVLREFGNKRDIAYALVGVADVVAALGACLRAASIWAASEQLREEIGSPLAPDEQQQYDQRVAAARAALCDDAAFDCAWQEGRELTLEQAIELASEESAERP